jgi:hypothetical protein
MTATAATLTTMVAIPANWMLKTRLELNGIRYSTWQAHDRFDLGQRSAAVRRKREEDWR